MSQLSEVDVQDDLEVLLARRRGGAPVQHQNGYSPVPAPVGAGVGSLSIGPGSSAAGGAYDGPFLQCCEQSDDVRVPGFNDGFPGPILPPAPNMALATRLLSTPTPA